MPGVDAGVSGEVVAWVEDVVLAELPRPVTGRSGDVEREQLVEGHTVFTTLDIQVWRNQTEGSIDVTGFVECDHNVNVTTGSTYGGVPYPKRVDRASVSCRVGEHVVVTPDPFYDPNAHVSPMYPTGRTIAFTTPVGDVGEAEEFVFTVRPHGDANGTQERAYYAWTTPIFEPWLHTDGRPKSFWMPLPAERLEEMGVKHFEIVLPDDPRLQR